MTSANGLDLTERNIVNEVKAFLCDQEMFLLQLKVPLVKINEIFHMKKESNLDQEWALTKGISYWLQNTKKPTWEDIAIALEKCSCYRVAWKIRGKNQGNYCIPVVIINSKLILDKRCYAKMSVPEIHISTHQPCQRMRSASKPTEIQPDQLDEDDDELNAYDYVGLVPLGDTASKSYSSGDMQHQLKAITTKYNSTAERISAFYIDVKEVIHEEKKALLTAHQEQCTDAENMEDALFEQLEEIIHSITTFQSKLEKSTNKLSHGDSSGLYVNIQVLDELPNLEKKLTTLDKGINKYDKLFSTMTTDTLTTSKRVIEDIKLMLRVDIYNTEEVKEGGFEVVN